WTRTPDTSGPGAAAPTPGAPPHAAAPPPLPLTARRISLPPPLPAFDPPPPLATAGRRDVSNVPAQALILMNDPFVAQQARRWAVRVLAMEGVDASGRVRRMYREAYARPPSEAELNAALHFLKSHAEELGIPPDTVGAD